MAIPLRQEEAQPAPLPPELSQFALDQVPYAAPSARTLAVRSDAFDWLAGIGDRSLHGVVTDPPYGLEEFEEHQLDKLHKKNNKGGIWRIPPKFDGHERSPLPRFTALSEKQRKALREFFADWSKALTPKLRPGAHVFVAGNAFLSAMVWAAIADGGLEFRGEIIRLVRTLRGGDRPKNAEKEFSEVCSMPRGCYEPWGLFRAPLDPEMKVSDALREYGTGGLRRLPGGGPFLDLIPSERTPKREKLLANHPSLKPQSFMRQIVYAALPLGTGVLADTFMGGGSTLAAAEAMGLHCVGTERYPDYFALGTAAVPRLADLSVDLQAHEHNYDLDLE